MTPGSPLPDATNRLLFWDETDAGAPDDVADGDAARHPDGDYGTSGRESMYVTLFGEMLNDVFKLEQMLFTREERGCIQNYECLDYNAKYLLVRICLRKADKWHRLDSLKYQTELGDTIPKAIQDLCKCDEFPISQPELKVKTEDVKREEVKVEEREIIDLTCSQDETPIPGPSQLPGPLPPDYSFFAQDDTHATLRELLECLTGDELKAVAKQVKVKVSTKRDTIVDALLSTSSTQTTLGFPVIASSTSKAKGKAKAESNSLVQTTLPFVLVPSKRQTQTETLREMVMKVLGQCIRVNSDVVNLFRRVNLVYFRSTQHTQSLLTPSILSRARKRAYAAYEYARTPDIWCDRAALLAYEDALAIEARMDAAIDGTGASTTRERTAASKTPGPGSHATQGTSFARVKQEGDQIKHEGGDTGKGGGEGAQGEDAGGPSNEEAVADSARVQLARVAKTILDEVYPRWQALVETKGEEAARPQGLERFDCGHILTRVVCKGSRALGLLKEHKRELEVLEALLAQHRWRRGRRGRWYERRALILMTHAEHTADTYMRALEGVKEALLDDDTHIVFRPMLERRLTRLEKKLELPREELHVCTGGPQKAEEHFIEGVRVHHRAMSLVLDPAGCVLNKPPATPIKGASRALALTQKTIPWAGSTAPEADDKGAKAKATGKSIWVGRDADEVTVEMLALQHYEARGYKGFHSEGRVVTTLFGLLFWDVLFAPVAGAFETPYQAAPLDLGVDTFYTARRAAADARLDALRAGSAPALVAQAWDAYAAQRTACVGVRWDLFEKADLVEIAECLGGPALALICRVLCEDYVARTGGLPDLLVWNAAAGEARFVEVKGPGDTLQENQKVWIGVLLQAGATVEVCRVVEKGTAPEPRGKKRKKGKTPKGKSGRAPARKRLRSEVEHIVESESEEVDYSQMDLTQTGDDEGAPPPRTPKRVNRAEVVITSSPERFPRSMKKRRLSP